MLNLDLYLRSLGQLLKGWKNKQIFFKEQESIPDSRLFDIPGYV